MRVELLERVERRTSWPDEETEVLAGHLHDDVLVLDAHVGRGLVAEALDDATDERTYKLSLLLDAHLVLLVPRCACRRPLTAAASSASTAPAPIGPLRRGRPARA